jgi:monofunctional biosynthetic peptidoglycan transglycosylase
MTGKTAAGQQKSKRRRRAGARWWRVWLRRMVIVLCVLAIAVLGSILLFRSVNPPFSMAMLEDKLIHGATLKRKWVPLEDISPNLRLAVVASEDGNFCNHWGVDWAAVREVVEKAKSLSAVRGASTISMQVAKNLYLWDHRSYLRKVLEVPLAYAMTVIWPKPRMIEIYLNIAQWGPGVYGAEAASRRYFGKPASALTQREAVLLAAALPNPLVRNPARPSRRMQLVANAVQKRLPWIAQRADCVSKP